MTLPAEPRNDAYARNYFPTGRKENVSIKDEAEAEVTRRHPAWHDRGVGIVQGSHYRSGFVAGAEWAASRDTEASATQTITHLEAGLNASRAREELAAKRIGETWDRVYIERHNARLEYERRTAAEAECDARVAQIAEALDEARSTGRPEWSMLNRIVGILSTPASDALNRVRAEALRAAVSRFENEIGIAELDAETSRDGIHWVNVEGAWEQQGVFMAWLRAEADRIEGA